MTQQVFDRDDFKTDGDEIKGAAIWSVQNLHGTTVTVESFNELVTEAFTLYGHVIRAQILEGISTYLADGNLTEAIIDKTINFLARRVDGCAASLGDMVSLVEETKTPGPRH